MSLLSFFSGAASAFNESMDKEREALAKAKEEAEKRKYELETYRKKKEIEAEFSTDKSKFVTAEQRAQLEAEEKKTNRYGAMGYGMFFTPIGENKYEVSYKEIKDAKGDEKLFGTMEDVQAHISSIQTSADKYNLGTPEISVTNTGKGFKVESKFKPTGGAGGEFTNLQQANEEVGRVQATINEDPLRKGKFVAKTERTKDGKYTVSVVQDPAFKAEGAAGPGVSPAGMKYGLDYLPLQSKQFNSMEEYKQRAGKFKFVRLVDENIPRWGEDQEKYAGGYNKQWTLVHTGGTGDSADTQLQDLATQFNTHMKPEFVKMLADVANKGGPVDGVDAVAAAIGNFINLHDETTKSIVGDHLDRVPVDVKHEWLKDYIGIHPKIDAALKGGLRKQAFEGTALAAVMPINEPSYTEQTDQGKVYRTPINPNVANAFAPEVETQPGMVVRKYPDTFTNLTYKIATDSGMKQGKFHSVLNTAGSPEAVQKAMVRHEEARKVLKNEQAFIQVDNRGNASYAIPNPGERGRAVIMSAVNSVQGHENRINMMQSLINSKEALDNVTGVMKDSSPQGRFSAITGKDAKAFRDLTDQLDTAYDITRNINELDSLLVEGAPVGAPLQLTRLEQGAKYMFNYLAGTLKTYEGAEVPASSIITGLRKQFEDASRMNVDPKAKQAALVNLLGTMLSYQLARLMDPNGRLSDEDRRTVQGAMGFEGIFANPDSARSVLTAMRDRADYVTARNTSLTSGTVENQLAAHAYDKYSRGGSFASMYTQVMPVSVDYTRGPTGGVTAPAGAGNPLFDDAEVKDAAAQSSTVAKPAAPAVPSMTSGTSL